MSKDVQLPGLDALSALSGIQVTPELLSYLTDDERALLAEYTSKMRQLQAVDRFADYVEYVHNGRWVPARHLVYVCDQIDAFLKEVTGKPYDILILNQPPQTGKSMTVTSTLPSYYLGKNPDGFVIIAGYSQTFAEQFGRANLSKVEEFGGSLFGLALKKSPKTGEQFEISGHEGIFIARGIMSGITGKSANLFIIDDPIKNEAEASSETYRNRLMEEWGATIKTRLHPGAKVIIQMTRWHEDDLVGRIIRYESENIWKYINLPLEAEDNDPLGRAPGQALCPEILGKNDEWVRQLKQSYQKDPDKGGMRTWYALQQGRPRILEGGMIKEGWFEYYHPSGIQPPSPHRVIMPNGVPGEKASKPLPRQFEEIIQSWDCTFKDATTSDYVVGTVWGRYGIDYYLLDMSRARRDIVDTMQAMRHMTAKWPDASLKLIEDKANGPAVISMLKNEITGIVAVNPKGSKDSRLSAVSHLFESGHIYIPHPAVWHWAVDVVDEFTAFPNGLHDDIVDSCTQAISRLSKSASKVFNSGPMSAVSAYFSWKPQGGAARKVPRAKGKARVI